MKGLHFRLISLLSILFVNNICIGQNAKSFFFPEERLNKTNFYGPDTVGNRTGFTRTIFYVKKDSSYDVTDVRMFGNSPSYIQTRSVLISDKEIKMIESTSTTYTETNKLKTYNPPRILFKMPDAGSTISWIYEDIDGKYYCTANRTIITINGKNRKAIKVTKALVNATPDMGVFEEYYVEGIGLYEVNMRAQGKVYSLDKFERLSFDSTATASGIAKFKNEEKKDSLSSGIFAASLGVRLMDIYNLTDEEKNDIIQSGKIAINIVVGDDGKVSSATYSPRYSTLVNQKMIEIAKKHALKLKFNKEDKGKKGTIVFSFKLQ